MIPSPADRSLAKVRLRAAWSEIRCAWDDARRERPDELGQLGVLISDETDPDGVPLVACLALDDIEALLAGTPDPAGCRAVLTAASAGTLAIVVLLGRTTVVASVPYDDFQRSRLAEREEP